jgi:hypothetical protein
MTVRPVAIRNSNIPYSTPLSVDVTISSSTTHHRWKGRTAFARQVPEQIAECTNDQSVFNKMGAGHFA